MTRAFGTLSHSALVALAEALGGGRLRPPFPASSLSELVPNDQVNAVRHELGALAEQGMTAPHIIKLMTCLAEERAIQMRLVDRVQLVLSPCDLDHVDARDTGVVVRELLRQAEHRVLIASYALDAGEWSRALFHELATLMTRHSKLTVTLCVNVHRKYQDDTPDAILIKRFAEDFRERVWPGARLPTVYYDPRALSTDTQQRASMHAKCITVDDRRVFLTSANFTEAAQERNIEAGVLLEDATIALRVRKQFETLIQKQKLKQLLM